jgi:thiosulfate reductase cytochrome b subunit
VDQPRSAPKPDRPAPHQRTDQIHAETAAVPSPDVPATADVAHVTPAAQVAPAPEVPPAIDVAPTARDAPAGAVAHGADVAASAATTSLAASRSVYRHALPTRIAHWLSVVCLTVLAMSGLQIFNAHPALYWGDRSDRDRPVLAIGAVTTPTGEIKGVTRVLGVELTTTGVLGASRDGAEGLTERAFPRWATLPSDQWLAMGRRWHFFFAWIVVLTGLGYVVHAFASRHVTHDLVPWPRDLRGLPASIRDHLRFRHPSGEAAARYNVLQKLAYTAVIFGLVPFIVLTGLCMSPRVDAAIPVLVRGLGGRQSARTLHFLAMFALLGFTATHLFMVAATGVVNNVRSMITGRYRIAAEEGVDGHGEVD